MEKDWVTRHSGIIGHSDARHSFYLALEPIGTGATRHWVAWALGTQSPRPPAPDTNYKKYSVVFKLHKTSEHISGTIYHLFLIVSETCKPYTDIC